MEKRPCVRLRQRRAQIKPRKAGSSGGPHGGGVFAVMRPAPPETPQFNARVLGPWKLGGYFSGAFERFPSLLCPPPHTACFLSRCPRSRLALGARGAEEEEARVEVPGYPEPGLGSVRRHRTPEEVRPWEPSLSPRC